MFITPEEFNRFVDRIAVDLGLQAESDEQYVYLTYDGQPAPARTRGIRLERPRVADRTLYLVQHDLRTSDPELPRLFDQIRRRWSRYLSGPVRATNVVHGGSASYRNIAFTAGALAVHEDGWTWRQEDVANLSFEPDPSANAPADIL
jgi:hypothetical protein